MPAPRLLALVLIALPACGGSSDVTPDAEVPTPDAPVQPDADPGAVPRAELTACRYEVPSSLGLTEGDGYACGDLVVFEDRVARGRTIRVHYIKFESPSASTNATIYLAGGPGGDGQSMVDYAAVLDPSFLAGLLADGDFLVINQRGTARSVPFLDCQAADCSDFASDYDLAQYNTASNADDVDELRASLGYDQLNVYGISYGSRLGLEVLRRHGDHVRAAVIEGLVPSSVAWPAAIPASFYSALTGLNASCAAAGACGTTFGDLVTKFSAGVTSLDANALTITVAGQPFDLDAFTYAQILFRVLYSRSSYAWLPLVISDVADRRTDRIESFLANALSSLGRSNISMGLYNTVVCGEIFSPPDDSAFTQANAGVPSDIVELFGYSWYGLMERCREWPVVPNLQAQLSAPVTSAVPTLVSSGRLDPITPPSFGVIAAATLTNATVVVHENSGHGATLQSPCGIQNLASFLANPTAAHDTSCAAAITTSYMLGSTLISPASLARIRAELALVPGLPPRR